VLLLCLFSLSFALAQNPNMGSWKLDGAKSEIPATVGKTTAVIYAAAGDMIKVTTDGLDAQGKPTHTEWTGKFDAKPYPVTGDPNVTYRAYKVKNGRLLLANMNGDKTVSNGKAQVAKDGKTRTLEMTYFGEKKQKTKAKFVYDKQS